MNAIDVDTVSKSFGNHRVLDGFSVSVPAGNCAALVGPSGSGKTTLLRLIAGIETPDAGRIAIGDTMVASEGAMVPPWQRGIGMVFQDLALWPHMRVARQLAFVLPGTTRAERKARIDALLALVELTGKRRAHPAQLSGGEQQRVAIARALAPEPPILLLDEPFAHLDARLRDIMVNHLAGLKRDRGVTIILATHHDADTTDLADITLSLA